MVLRRRYTSSPRIKLAIALCLSLAALALASGTYMGTSRTSVKAADKAVLSGIAPIYRQISEQAGQAIPVGGARSLLAEGTPFPAEFLHLGNYAEEADAGTTWEVEPVAPHIPLAAVAVSSIGGPWLPRGGVRRLSMSEDLTGATALVFNNSFSSLFSKIFDLQEDESNRRSDSAAENRNPFAEAKQKDDAARSPASDTSQGSRDRAGTESKPPESASSSGQEVAAVNGSGARPERYAFLGDFDGSGMLSILTAERAGEASFAFADGIRTFSLFVNSSAVEKQKSLALDDIDGDGILDLLATERSSLFGGVFMGDGAGGYRFAGTFVTGYEPVLATVGPEAEGGREIVTVNTRSGMVIRFRLRGEYYQRYSITKLPSPPQYVSHIEEAETGADYLEVAQSGRSPLVYQLPAAGGLERHVATLPSQPSLEAGPAPGLGSGIGSIRIYQVGQYASIVLANSAGKEFNVANLRVSPQACLVLGDLKGSGSLDVGVAHLISFAPSR